MAVIIGDLKLGNLWHSQSEVFKLLARHTTRYPVMGLQDIYKLLYQGALGSEHVNDSFESFEHDLMEEWEAVEANDKIPIWENVCPDGQLVRFHLAPYKARGGEIENLKTLCFWSTALFTGSREDLLEGWKTFLKTSRERRWYRFPDEEINDFDLWLRKYKYPPVHHTENYRKAYRPAYRLLMRDFLGNLVTTTQG